ncbi:MAG: DUF262 domain-containing protein [Candidatus Accumulibacter sp.]|uniref:DUF262 domain-containing protein n=1 Tax=Candidatus Accumulibacter affinis TaxID=2954384 RepID=A0A935TB09_9PROT|nr:DUF262 domain-containing protein [Candidatus Accumulibacter affinis]
MPTNDDFSENTVESWFEDETGETDDFQIKEYDITASPNDFNMSTMFSFIESGAVKIPGFQRNYVWDIKRASKLMESIIIGLPIPQIFLYEEERNKFLVIDGQQRLMSIYYFIKQRFPKKERRLELRRIFDEHGKIPDEILQNDDYFVKFNLQLVEHLPNRPNRLNKLNYGTLGELKTTFDLRTVRNIIIKQNVPDEDDDGVSSIYEIFNRLNTGGVNLKPQEIRTILYHSDFYEMLYRINLDPRWRLLLGLPEPDLHMKDIEILLRAFAMMMSGRDYKPSMVRFLNLTSKRAGTLSKEKVQYLGQLFDAFLDSCRLLNEKAFFGAQATRVNISFIDAVFAVQCSEAFSTFSLGLPVINPEKLKALKLDPEFENSAQFGTASSVNVAKRLERATAILRG